MGWLQREAMVHGHVAYIPSPWADDMARSAGDETRAARSTYAGSGSAMLRPRAAGRGTDEGAMRATAAR